MFIRIKRRRVNAYCEGKHGSKVALAAHLGIDKQAMNKILTRANEPGGEKVLAMLGWIEKTRRTKPRKRPCLVAESTIFRGRHCVTLVPEHKISVTH